MEEHFIITSDTPVYLYGAASIGKIVYEKNPSLNICGFLDARAEEIGEFMGLPVYTVSQAAERINESDAVIMVSVKNVFELEDIAVTLYDAGFFRLIYKARAVLEGRGNADDLRLSETWDMLVAGSFSADKKELPCFQKGIHYFFENQSVLSKEDGKILAYIPVEMIYTNDGKGKWWDLNIQGYYPHIYFFYYLSNHRNGQVKDYLEFTEQTALTQGDIKITDAWRQNVLRNRTAVYENMRLNLDVNPQFFQENAPTAVWNEKGYFNLTSGKHRCAFLVSQGYRYIAVKATEEDYNSFLSFENSESIRSKIIEENIRQVSSKIYHPWFYRYPCSEPAYYTHFQVEVLCRTIRLANKYGRIIRLCTNLPEGNSLFRILRRCRLVQTMDETSTGAMDIVLMDEMGKKPAGILKMCTPETVLWHIGMSPQGNILAEYYSEQGTVYFWEKAD